MIVSTVHTYVRYAWLEASLCIFTVSVTWNGTTITGPILIYYDEIRSAADTILIVDDSNEAGNLVCRSENHKTTNWRYPRGPHIRNLVNGDYQQVQSPGSLPSLSRLYTTQDTSTDPQYNGLWVCVLVNTDGGLSDQDFIDSFVYVGIYNSRNIGKLYIIC